MATKSIINSVSVQTGRQTSLLFKSLQEASGGFFESGIFKNKSLRVFYFLITVQSIHLFTGYILLHLSLFQTGFPVNYWDDLSGVCSDFYYSNMQHHFTSAPIFTCHGTAGIDGGHGTVQQMAGLQRLDAKPS